MENDSQERIEAVREAAGAIARRFSLNYWREHDKSEEYPWDFVRAFADQGWLGCMMPEGQGGMGLGITEASVLMHEISASGAGQSGASAVHFYLFAPGPILKHGSDEMKAEFLPKIASGELLMAFGITEPDAGVDTSRIKTKATRSGNRWIINGQKVWTTNAQHAQRILILARTSPRVDDRPLHGLTLFFTELDRSKCQIRKIDKLGRACIDSNEVFIDGLEARDEDIVGTRDEGFRCLLDGLNPERICVAMEAVGIGRAALRLATNYAKQRVVFDRPIGMNQAIAHPLAESWARLTAAEMLALRAGELYDSGKSCGIEANAAKFLAADAGFKATDVALQVHGGFGYSKEYHVERLWREARLYQLAPISQEMTLNFLARRALGLPRSY